MLNNNTTLNYATTTSLHAISNLLLINHLIQSNRVGATEKVIK
jgi:hypothetical protein